MYLSKKKEKKKKSQGVGERNNCLSGCIFWCRACGFELDIFHMCFTKVLISGGKSDEINCSCDCYINTQRFVNLAPVTGKVH